MKKAVKSAYSLLELSIVIVIISILIAGALSVSTNGINNAKTKITQERMHEIYKAMGNFLITNRRLPCPAAITAVETIDSNYGAEVDGDDGCDSESGVFISGNLAYGMVPVRALGLSNEMAKDGFDSKISYIVDVNFTNSSPANDADFASENFSVTSAGTITVNAMPSSITQEVVSDAVMALVSHGTNKAGAYNPNSSTANSRGSDQEVTNDFGDTPTLGTPSTSDFDNILVSTQANSDVFDDIIFFKRKEDFVEDFNAMFLIACDGTETTGSIISTTDAYYEQVREDVTGCTLPAKRTRKCGAYGVWFVISDGCI